MAEADMDATTPDSPPVANEAGPPSDDAIISIRKLTKSFGSHQVLKDITFDIPRGKISAIMGPSGTGKSVLLNHIIGLLKPDGGEVWIDGEEITKMRDRDLMEVRRKLGVLFQDGALFGSLTVFDNIAFPLREHTKKSESDIKDTVLEKAGLVGLLDHMKKMPGEISGGMKKRAGLARALAMDPKIVLFDEPDSGLDPVRVSYLDELVKKTQEETGASFFIITHNIPSAMRTCDYLGVLFRSGLVKFASKEEMRESDDEIIRQFLRGRAFGPIGMDEMAEEETDVEKELVERAQKRVEEEGEHLPV
jgi:phospholipid/cholesterol/gamma-HCH transport system ATP-binding protein